MEEEEKRQRMEVEKREGGPQCAGRTGRLKELLLLLILSRLAFICSCLSAVVCLFALISLVILQREHCVCSASREPGETGRGGQREREREEAERKKGKENHIAVKSALVSSS